MNLRETSIAGTGITAGAANGKRPTRILFVFNSVGGGASFGIYAMLPALLKEGCEAWLAAPHGEAATMARFRHLFKDVQQQSMPWWNLPPPSDWTRRLAVRMARWRLPHSESDAVKTVVKAIRRWNIDVVYTDTALTRVGALAARQAEVRHIWHIKECVGSGQRVQFPLTDAKLARFIATHSERVVVMSDFIGRFYREHGCVNLVVIPDGVDCHQFGMTGSRNFRSELGVGPEEPVIAMVASLSSVWKQHEVFIRMAAIVARSNPRARFVLIGPWPKALRWPHDAPWRYFERLQVLASALVPSGRVEFRQFAFDAPDLMRSIDVLVHTCDIEPFGRVAVEAMAVGTPVIGPKQGGISETVVDGLTGLLVAPGDPGAFAETLQMLLKSTSRSKEMGLRAAAHVRSNYSIAVHARRLMAILAPR